MNTFRGEYDNDAVTQFWVKGLKQLTQCCAGRSSTDRCKFGGFASGPDFSTQKPFPVPQMARNTFNSSNRSTRSTFGEVAAPLRLDQGSTSQISKTNIFHLREFEALKIFPELIYNALHFSKNRAGVSVGEGRERSLMLRTSDQQYAR